MRNFLLIISSIFLTLVFVEFILLNFFWLSYQKDKWHLPDQFSKNFYEKYYKQLHHLRDFKKKNYDMGLMYTSVKDEQDKESGKKYRSTVLINGDSWAENLLYGIVFEELVRIKKKEKINLIVSGSSSYSFSPTTIQLKILRNDFNIVPEKIITIIDHTDVGDEICRYKNNLEFDENGTLLRIKPEELYSGEVYAIEPHFARFDILDSKDLNIIKLLKYEILKRKIKKNIKKTRCTFTELMRPVKNNLDQNEFIHLKKTTLRYIDTVFSDKNVEKLLLVVHPHIKHFTGKYKFYFGDFLREILPGNIHEDKIALLDFREIFDEVYFNDYQFQKYQDIFLVTDPSSHLNRPGRIPFVNRIFNELLH